MTVANSLPDAAVVAEVAPLLRRVVDLDAGALSRWRGGPDRLAVLVRLPFALLAGRTLADPGSSVPDGWDATFAAADVVRWFDAVAAAADPSGSHEPGEAPAELPPRRDVDWRWPVPPARGWTRVETVPDDVVRPLVRQGALTLKEIAQREGVADLPGAQPRAEVADALLDTVVLRAAEGTHRAEVTLRALSSLTRLGFLPRGGSAAIDVAGRWVRVAAGYGSVYLETATGLSLSPLSSAPRRG